MLVAVVVVDVAVVTSTVFGPLKTWNCRFFFVRPNHFVGCPICLARPFKNIFRRPIFFKRNGLLLNWREFEKLDHTQKINTLAMIAPITNEEKQKLLESVSIENKVETLESIISFYLYETSLNNQTIQ